MTKKDEVKEEKKTSKKDLKTIEKINKLLDYYNNYEDNKCSKASIKETREELFKRLFNNKNALEINDKKELITEDKKKIKLDNYESFEEIENVLESSKDPFSFLLYDKNRKPGLLLDIIGFIILTIIAIGFIYAKYYIIGTVFIICYVSLYLVTFLKDRKKH